MLPSRAVPRRLVPPLHASRDVVTSNGFDGLAPRVWEFSVSGYRVLKRWVEARAGLDGATWWPQFRDIAARINELLHWFDEADLVLEAVLADTLSREELGLEPETEE